MITEGLLEGDEILKDIRCCPPSSDGMCDGAKVFVHLPFEFSFLVQSTTAVPLRADPVTVTDTRVNGVASPFLLEVQFLGRCVFGMIPPLRFGFGYLFAKS